MDKQKLDEEINRKILNRTRCLSERVIDARKKPNFSATGNAPAVLEQRHFHRKVLFWFSIVYCSCCFLGLAVIIGFQLYCRMTSPETDLFPKYELEILTTGVFAQFLGLLKIITASIWDDKAYLDAGILADKKALH